MNSQPMKPVPISAEELAELIKAAGERAAVFRQERQEAIRQEQAAVRYSLAASIRYLMGAMGGGDYAWMAWGNSWDWYPASAAINYGADGPHQFEQAKTFQAQARSELALALQKGDVIAVDGDGVLIPPIHWDEWNQDIWSDGVGRPGQYGYHARVRIVGAELAVFAHKRFVEMARPKPNSFAESDAPLVEEMHAMIATSAATKGKRLSIEAAAAAVAPRALSHGSFDSVVDRLRKLYSSKYPTRKKRGAP